MTDNTKQAEPETTVTLRKADLKYALSLVRWELDKAMSRYTEATRGYDIHCNHCMNRLGPHSRKALIDTHAHLVALEAMVKRVEAAARPPEPTPTAPAPAPAAEPTTKKTRVRGRN
jgi:hypothetical protein